MNGSRSGTWVAAWVLVSATALPARAQDTKVPVVPANEEENVDPPQVAVHQNEPSLIRRGFYVTGDFGGYFSFGGRNTNDRALPSRTVSNFQPTLGLNAGYDLLTTDSILFSAGIRFAALFNAGSGRISDAELTSEDPAVLATRPADFTMLQIGAGGRLGFLLTERLALNGIADLGLALVDPDPAASATDEDGGGTAFGLLFGLGAGLEAFALFPGFSIGLDVKFVGTLVSSNLIPGVSITAPLKYNF